MNVKRIFVASPPSLIFSIASQDSSPHHRFEPLVRVPHELHQPNKNGQSRHCDDIYRVQEHRKQRFVLSDTFSSKVLTAIKNKVDYSLITKSSPSSTLNQLGSHTRLDSQQVLESPTPTQEEAPTCTKIARAVQVLSCAPRRLRSPNKYLEPPEDRLEVCRKVHLDQGDEAKFLEESDSDLAHLR